MTDAIRVYVRYELPADRGNAENRNETRREYNTRFGHSSPPLIVPEAGQHLWDWYFDLSHRLRRARDGAAEPIAPTEFAAWVSLTHTIVYPSEYAILAAMDAAYCDELNKEILAQREAAADEARKK